MNQKRRIKKLNKILKKIKSYKEKMSSLTDEQLSALTDEFKVRLQNKETLDDILPEAFAAICEADKRVLGKEPYDVQILGGIALHQGLLAEMNTGEGKTLVATMPLYLNALTGKGTILVTTNSYLALRDAQEMGQVYNFMGLTVAAGVKEDEEEKFSNEEKKQVYGSDIVYTTHGVLGFDYLLNNLVTDARDRFMRELYYVVIDEADSVLLDGAQTPLVISGVPRVQSNLYDMADYFVRSLVEKEDYETEDKKVWLTEEGVRYAENYFGIDNFYGKEFFEINRHVILALRAHVLFKMEKDYVISKDHELQLIDNESGRKMAGVKLRGGMHQALEVKEHLELSQENRAMASITYRNLFMLFEKMAGMSGTIIDAKEELADVYGKQVVAIPPNCKVQRKDLKDLFFLDADSQFQAAIEEAQFLHSTGQPVIIVVATIAETEMVSSMLVEREIPHNVLNANNAFWEAEIIKEAGRKYAVTVATSMAGRGTDIKLQEGVKELGGLAVIGIGRMFNNRQERQARGRAGRQGDPGVSRFYVSLQDEVVNQFSSGYMEKYITGKKKLSKRRKKILINASQKLGEEHAVSTRKNSIEYDEILLRQRNVMYETRNRLLDGGTMEFKKILKVAGENIDSFLQETRKPDAKAIHRFIYDNISYEVTEELTRKILRRKKRVKKFLMALVEQRLEHQKEMLGEQEVLDEFIRVACLSSIDQAWVEQVDYLQQLQAAVSGRTMAQRNLLYEYQQEAVESYLSMKKIIYKNIIRNILLSEVEYGEDDKLSIIYP